MKEKELLNAMSEIKDEYVDEAADALERETVKSVAGKSASRKFNWKPWAAGIAAVLAIGIGIGSMGLDRMGRSSDAAVTEEAYYEEYSYASNGFATGSSEAAEAPTEAMTESYDGATVTSGSSDIAQVEVSEGFNKSETKLVYRADLSIETLDFDETEAALKELVDSLGGYFESSSIENGGYYSDGSYKYGYYTVRIPTEKYSEFMSSAQGSWHVSYVNESVEDIGEEYFDVETRLATLNTKLDRLHELLKNASNLSDIIELESELSDTEFEIDYYTSTLNRYDSLVGYSTIDINIDQVYRVDDSIQQSNGFFARLWRNLKNGVISFVDNIADLIYWAAYNLIGIIIIVVAIIIIRKNHLISRLWNWLFHRKKKGDEEDK